MTTAEERLDTFRENLRRLTTEGGRENFVVFETVGSGRIVQCASRRGEDVAIMDVPLAGQGIGPAGRERLRALGFAPEAGVDHRVNEEELAKADPEVKAALHEWILAGRDPQDPRVPELVARRVLDEVRGDAPPEARAPDGAPGDGAGDGASDEPGVQAAAEGATTADATTTADAAAEAAAQSSYQAIVDPERGARLAERVFRDVLEAPEDYDVFVELELS